MADPLIAAAALGRYRFAHLRQAQAVYERIVRSCMVAKLQTDHAEPSLTLWIRGFGLTAEDITEGYAGHFARIFVGQLPEHRLTLMAEKIPTPLAKHPERLRPKRHHPDWGHPVLRAARNGKHYPSLEEAMKQLEILHADFPEISIPAGDTLYIMVYDGKLPPAERVQKYILKAQEDEGNWRLMAALNRGRKKPAATDDAKKRVTPQGRFTTIEASRRKAKPRKKPPGHDLRSE